MFCKNCGTQNADGVKFCRACGTPIDQVAPAAPVAAAPAAPVSAAPTPGYAPNPAYTPNPGYAPDPGYNPHARYAPRPATPMPEFLKKVPGIALIVAIVSLLLPWFGYGVRSYTTYISLTQIVATFEAWSKGFGSVMMYLFGLICLAAPFVCMRLDKKKIPFGKFIGIGVAVLALITMFLAKDWVKEVYGWESLKTHMGFYFYMIAMLTYGGVGLFNDYNKN